jgi:hypothetical protein
LVFPCQIRHTNCANFQGQQLANRYTVLNFGFKSVDGLYTGSANDADLWFPEKRRRELAITGFYNNRKCHSRPPLLYSAYSMELTKRSQHKRLAQKLVNPITMGGMSHAFRGSGPTIINGQPFHWQKGDTFIVPLWSWHEHANASSKDEAILFSMHDEPILRAFGLYREEVQASKSN